MMKKKKNNKGFSLVELIVVIAIMAVLVGVLAPQFIKYVESSRQSTDMQNVEQMKTAVEVAAADGTITSATIERDGNDVKIVPVGGTIDSTKTTVALKSSAWTANFKYSFNGSTWTVSTSSGTTTDHNKSLDSIFN